MEQIQVFNLVIRSSIEYYDILYDFNDIGFCSEYMQTINNEYTQIVLF
jgi:hypothetical protein